jgi:hypothetical protein
MSPITILKWWLWISALASVAGWVLSAVGMLNEVGYLAFAGLCLIVWRFWPKESGEVSRRHWRASRLKRRFSRWLPALFLGLALLIFLGGLLYLPTNYAGLSYRTPRVLHWLSEEGWFWIHSNSYRLNNRAAGFEWLSAPIILFTRSDRLLFLLNYIPFLLLPGLTFSVCKSLGVSGRVAWWWMWILPTGYNFILQAGSIANDTFPAIYAVAAVFFGVRAWSSRDVADCWYSFLAAALLTGAKASNLPLLLPWALLMVPLMRLWLQKPLRGAVVVGVSVAASFLITAALNIKYCGDWSGLNLERAGMSMNNPVVGLWGNAFLLTLNNFVPPVFPFARWWNASAETILPGFLVKPMLENFELGFLTLWELPGEDWVGIGFGVSLLLLVSVLARIFMRGDRCVSWHGKRALPGWLRRGVLLSPWVALLVYCLKSGMVTPARLISPYYPLLLPLLLLGHQQLELVRRKWWRGLVFLTVLMSFPVLIVTPARPLWPAQKFFETVLQWKPGWRLGERGLTVYRVYAERSDPLPHLREALPKDLKLVGFLGDGDDLDISFWRPFFARQVKHLRLKDSAEDIRRRGIEYAIVGGAYLRYQDTDFSEWLERTGAEVIAERTGLLKVSEGPQPWYVVRFR